jgi:hypothetical protein
MKRNALTPERAEDLVFGHSNLRLLSRKVEDYKSGSSEMWEGMHLNHCPVLEF